VSKASEIDVRIVGYHVFTGQVRSSKAITQSGVEKAPADVA